MLRVRNSKRRRGGPQHATERASLPSSIMLLAHAHRNSATAVVQLPRPRFAHTRSRGEFARGAARCKPLQAPLAIGTHLQYDVALPLKYGLTPDTVTKAPHSAVLEVARGHE